MLANLPLVGRFFGDVESFSTLEDAQRIVEKLQAELHLESQQSSQLKLAMAGMREERVADLRGDIEELKQQRTALLELVSYVNETIDAKEAAISRLFDPGQPQEPAAAPQDPLLPTPGKSLASDKTSNEFKPSPKKTFPADLLLQADDETTNAIIEVFGDDPVFEAKSRGATDSLLRRDAEDDEKLAKGIALAVERGVLHGDVMVEPVVNVDVTGRSADEVAGIIFEACRGDNDDEGTGKIVVIQGLSGTGKGTTVSKLRNKFKDCVTWSNGNVFRTLTLLALEHCSAKGVELDESVLTRDNLHVWINMLRFDLFPGEGYDIEIDGLGLHTRVSTIANTKLKEPRIAAAIPTVAGFSQGEVVVFANAALQRMRQDGLTCIVEGRAPTLAHVRSPHRFELVIDDPLLLGARRVAQRVAALALRDLPDAPDDAQVGSLLQDIVNAL